MLTTGLLLSLHQSAPIAELTRCLAEHPAFSPGTLQGSWLPVVMEAADDAESRELHDWVAEQPGVAFVDVVHVNFDETPAASDPI
ncbi:MAG: hypothetical protein EOP86_07960 [Verrucomicrobiaceae bacterium]|nr:MAG: hypothetical protein EOP86_07960 [Verrucomicrobiaceae bacterium]